MKFFTIDWGQLRDHRGRFARATEGLLEDRREDAKELGRNLINALRREAPKDTGHLREQMWFRTDIVGNKLDVRIGSGAFYTPFVVRGTRPHTPPISALEGWALRHGIPVGAVWGSIRKRGTSVEAERRWGMKGNEFQTRAYNQMREETMEWARKIGTKIRERFTR